MLRDADVMFFLTEAQKQGIRSQLIHARLDHVHGMVVLAGEQHAPTLPRDVGQN